MTVDAEPIIILKTSIIKLVNFSDVLLLRYLLRVDVQKYSFCHSLLILESFLGFY